MIKLLVFLDTLKIIPTLSQEEDGLSISRCSDHSLSVKTEKLHITTKRRNLSDTASVQVLYLKVVQRGIVGMRAFAPMMVEAGFPENEEARERRSGALPEDKLAQQLYVQHLKAWE